jgi:hypothetical protein
LAEIAEAAVKLTFRQGAATGRQAGVREARFDRTPSCSETGRSTSFMIAVIQAGDVPVSRAISE